MAPEFACWYFEPGPRWKVNQMKCRSYSGGWNAPSKRKKGMRAMLSFRSVFFSRLPLHCVVLCNLIKGRKETFFSLPFLDFIKLLSYVFAITALFFFFFKHPAPFFLLLSSWACCCECAYFAFFCKMQTKRGTWRVETIGMCTTIILVAVFFFLFCWEVRFVSLAHPH